ncbi:MAG: RsmB/NOP family class I SAM-dependent RNA methyltransferase [Parvularculaceae bacterium]
MRDAGRIAASIAILEDFEQRRVPLKTAIADWSRNNRYAGAKDRAWISGLCLDVLRRRRSLAAMMNDESARGAVLAALHVLWGRSVETIAELAAEEPHGAGALSEKEQDSIARLDSGEAPGALSTTANFPEWLEPSVTRAFGDDAEREMTAFSERADIDLRINTLKATPEKALAALKTVTGEAHPFVATAARIAAPDPSEKAPPVTVIPAFNKGWVEVQDLGSQIAALSAGDIKGAQVFDYCAGGGGKTLALASMMENTGQLYAYDRDARRMRPLYDRARRAGLRNLQIVNPSTDRETLGGLKEKMDVVFVDAPCTGCGTWRRHPDTKWRLTEQQLARRMSEQDAVLKEAAQFVRPGGRLVYVTCSFLMEENEDRLDEFLSGKAQFSRASALEAIRASGLITEAAEATLKKCETGAGALRLTPARTGTDAFFVSLLRCAP